MEKWETNETVVIWLIIFGLILITVVIFFSIYIKVSSDKIQDNLIKESQLKLTHQKSLLKTYILAQEEERARIAADIHDGLIGKLVAAKLQIEKDGNANSMQLLSRGIKLARNISHNLHDPWVDIQSLEELIYNLKEVWEEKFSIEYKIDIRHEKKLLVESKVQIMRILEELLVNIEKHASASEIQFHLRWTIANFSIILKDNGRGFDQSIGKKGRGLKNIESRVQFLKGKYKIKSGATKGTIMILVLNL